MHSSNPLDAFCLAMNSGSRFPSTDSDVNNATLCHQQQQQPQQPIRSTSLSSSDLTLSRGNSNTEIGYLPSSHPPPPQDHLLMLNSSKRHLEPTTTSSTRERGSKSSGGSSNITAPATSAYPSLKSLSPCSSSGSFTGTSPQAVPLLGPTTISRPGLVASPSQEQQQQQYVTVQLPNQEAGHHLVLQQPKPQLLIPGVAPLLAAPLVVAPPPPVSNGGGGVSLPPPPTYGATVGPCMPTPNPSNNSSHNSSKQQSIISKAINYGEMWRNKHGGKKNKV